MHGRGMDRHGHRLRQWLGLGRLRTRLGLWLGRRLGSTTLASTRGRHCSVLDRHGHRSRLRKGRRWVLDRIPRRTHSRGLGRRSSRTGWPGRGGRRHGQTLSNTGGLHVQQVLKHASAKSRRHCVEERRDGAVVDVLSEQGVAALHDLTDRGRGRQKTWY